MRYIDRTQYNIKQKCRPIIKFQDDADFNKILFSETLGRILLLYP